MINLDIDPYCQNCPEFKPKVTKENLFSKVAEEYEGTETFITCKHEKRCRSMVKWLKERAAVKPYKEHYIQGEVTVEDCSHDT